MSNEVLNLEPIKEFLDKEISAEEISKQLDEIAFDYGQAVIRDIHYTSGGPLADHLYYLRELRNIFMKASGKECI